MSRDLTEPEINQIRQGIQEKYDKVAAQGPSCCFRYPTGKEGLAQQGYPLELLQDFPEKILAAFCGVGNPFSLGPLSPGDAVLDIGCGAGVDSLVAGRMVGPTGRVVGIDVTAAMLAQARENQTRLGLGQVSFQVGDAKALPFPDNDFDAVISNGVLNLTLNKAQALEETHRVLKPGGRLMLADMVLVAALPPNRQDQVANWYQWIGGAIPGKDFLGLMLQAGFHRAKLAGYTGFKSSPYTEGALFYGEKLVHATARDTNAAQARQVVESLQEAACEPSGAWKPK